MKPVKVIAASAGTGKTYRLSNVYVDGLKERSDEEQAGILATTFTVKAANELVERVRRALLSKGEWLAAQGVLSGYLGTINSVCGRILSEHALSAGLSPDISVIADDRQPTIFAIATDSVMHRYADRVRESAHRLQMDNWRDSVHKVINLARNNAIEISALDHFAESSWSSFSALFPAATETAAALDDSLFSAIESTIVAINENSDGKDTTTNNLDQLRQFRSRLIAGQYLTWRDWAFLAKIKSTKKTSSAFKALSAAAAKHHSHPRLHEDVRTMIFSVFNCAAAAMQYYAEFKRSNGLIDFIDQETLALSLLDTDDVREMFSQQVRALLVDEFQDTSPIQLAIFLELAKLVDYSVWVGDEKQSIFGFRGSDPELMQSTVERVVATTGGDEEKLTTSYRSRPQLIQFTNDLFSKCAHLMQIKSTDVLIEKANRREVEGQPHPLHVWWLPPILSKRWLNQWRRLSLRQMIGWLFLEAETNSFPSKDPILPFYAYRTRVGSPSPMLWRQKV